MHSCSICSFWCSRQELRSGCGGSHCHSCSAASPVPAPPTPFTPARPCPRSLGEGVRLGVPRGECEAGEEEAGEEVEEEEEAGARAKGMHGSQWLRRIALANLSAPGNGEVRGVKGVRMFCTNQHPDQCNVATPTHLPTLCLNLAQNRISLHFYTTPPLATQTILMHLVPCPSGLVLAAERERFFFEKHSLQAK